jgi:transformation/transcription domain-associated protein
MSFVAYFLRMSAPTLQSYRNAIPSLVVRLLKDCPAEGASHRKELLIAARHILQTDFRNAFVPHIDTLVDDRVLIGVGITCHEQLRPLAYSMIADLVHHVREDLSITTLAHVVHIYSCNLHDPTLAPSIQTMCSKLLLNLTENVVKTETEDATHILYRSLETFVRKIENLAECRDDWKRWSRPAGVTAKAMHKQGKEAETPATKSESQGQETTESKDKDEIIEQPKAAAEDGQDVEMEDADTAVVEKEEKPVVYQEDDIDEVDIERAKPIAQNSAMTDTTTDLLRGKPSI